MPAIDPRSYPRNARLLDTWSFLHLAGAAGLVVIMPPLWALTLAVLWEPFENLLLSPALARFGILFGRETFQNSVMDLVFDLVGVWLGVVVLHPVLPGLRFLG